MRRVACVIVAGLLLPGLAGEGFKWRIDAADEILRPDMPEADSMGGLAWVSNSTYWAITDEKKKPVVWTLELPSDAVTGKVSECRMSILCRPEGVVDAEALVRDPLDGSMWIADERSCTITRHDPLTGRRMPNVVELPQVLKRFYKDSGLESLTIAPDGLAMWTCAEEAVEPDGPRSDRTHGTDVRLVRLVRASVGAPWRVDGQWVYRTDSIAGKSWLDSAGKDMSRSGIAELCVLEDGSLLVLEREFSVVMIPRLRCRLYEVDFTGATDVASWETLSAGGAAVQVQKRLLHETMGFSMYEGMCVGPKLADGSRLLVFVSDGDKRSLRSVLTLRLSRRRGVAPSCEAANRAQGGDGR